MSDYATGQRWVSNTESELGLGIVIEVSNRRVFLSFPASAERRTYAADNAPLSRVIYQVGETVSSNEDKKLKITNIQEHQRCFIYAGIDEDGNTVVLPEIDLNSFVQFSKPQDRLFSGQIDKNRSFELRCYSMDQTHILEQSDIRGLMGPRVELLPHQMYIAKKTGQRFAPRVLLADEVGLGKTIEAGLIIHQQIITSRVNRVMIIVPDSLIHQWMIEMLRRFNLQFSIFDEERCLEEESSASDNPFEGAQLILCSLSFLTDQPERHQQALEASWDLLVVDEAHHLQWSTTQVSAEYQCIESLAAQSLGLLLLTATPEQLGVDSHFARLRLLDPDRYHDLELFKKEEESYQPVNSLVQALLASVDLDAENRALKLTDLMEPLAGFLGEESIERIKELHDAGEDEQAVEVSVQELLDFHGTGRVLFRNTRSAVEGFPERCLTTYKLDAPENFTKDEINFDIKQRLTPELVLGDEWVSEDTRLDWLVDWLAQHATEKVLLICAKADTALQLEEYLRLKQGVRSAVFHEGISLINRDRAAAYFADEERGAQILVCSEIGSEGRNFQFSHHLILFDLPLNPDLLEQRIGRLDRIGQRMSVSIHVPYYSGSVQERLMTWYDRALNAFEKVNAIGNTVYRSVEGQLLKNLDQDLGKAFDAFIQISQVLVQKTLASMEQGRDRLLELNSCNRNEAIDIVETIASEERAYELNSYMERVFDQFGVEQEPHCERSLILSAGVHMSASFPSLPEDGLTVTFQRNLALSREDIQFLSWEHPMVRDTLDMIVSGEFGNTALCTIHVAGLKPSTILLEAIFIISCPAPKAMQLSRYLPQTKLRLVIDQHRRNYSEILTEERLNKLAKNVALATAQELMRKIRSQVSPMINLVEQLAASKLSEYIDPAIDDMEEQLGKEERRLQALSRVNPNIRQAEIDYVSESKNLSKTHLRGAQFKLDALRVIVAI